MQVVLFTNDTTISKGMVKYASNLSRESIVDVEGTIAVPQEPIAACTQSEVVLGHCSCLERHCVICVCLPRRTAVLADQVLCMHAIRVKLTCQS